MSLTTAWEEYQRNHEHVGTSGEIQAAFLAGYRSGAKDQWEADVQAEFNNHIADATTGRNRR